MSHGSAWALSVEVSGIDRSRDCSFCRDMEKENRLVVSWLLPSSERFKRASRPESIRRRARGNWDSLHYDIIADVVSSARKSHH